MKVIEERTPEWSPIPSIERERFSLETFINFFALGTHPNLATLRLGPKPLRHCSPESSAPGSTDEFSPRFHRPSSDFPLNTPWRYPFLDPISRLHKYTRFHSYR